MTAEVAASRYIHPGVRSMFPGAPTQPVTGSCFASVDLGLRVDDKLQETLRSFIVVRFDAMADMHYQGIVVGLSGGLDSVVCAGLCAAALGAHRTLAVTVLVGSEAERSHLLAASRQASVLGLQCAVIEGGPTMEAAAAAWKERGPWSPINLETRVVQSLVQLVADGREYAICATMDRSERLLGRYTEAFYGQIAPLSNLYKSEVGLLARLTGFSAAMVDDRPGCEGHWYDDEVLGAGYDVLDPILHLLSSGLTPEQIAATYGIADVRWLHAIAQRLRLHPLRLSTAMPNREGPPA